MHLSVNFLPIHFAVPMDYLLQNATTVASANNSLYNDRHFVSQHNSFSFHVNTEILVSIKEPVFFAFGQKEKSLRFFTRAQIKLRSNTVSQRSFLSGFMRSAHMICRTVTVGYSPFAFFFLA